MKLKIVLFTTILTKAGLFKRFAHDRVVPSLYPVMQEILSRYY